MSRCNRHFICAARVFGASIKFVLHAKKNYFSLKMLFSENDVMMTEKNCIQMNLSFLHLFVTESNFTNKHLENSEASENFSTLSLGVLKQHKF